MANAIAAVDPRELFDRFEEDWERLFGWSRFPGTSGLFDRAAYPAFDVVETEEGCTVSADIPGVDRKDLEVSITSNVLTVQGEKKPEDKDSGVYRDETWTGSFRRSISLPSTVDPDTIAAEFRDGVLKITVARRPEHKARQIPVKVK